MSYLRRLSLALLAALLLGAASGRADELRPIQGETVILGSFTGVAYYTAEPGGDRIVATLSSLDSSSQPLRVVATLSPGQSLVLSVPRGPGEPAIEIVFSRRGAHVFVSSSQPRID